MENKFDVIVLGAGIAGLTISSELSRKYKVLVIEKNRGDTSQNKAWVTEEKLIIDNNLESCIINHFDKCYLEGYSNNKFYLYHKGCSVDENNVLQIFKDRIIKQGSLINYNEKFIKYIKQNNNVQVITNKGSYYSKLIIDCMGIYSSIAYKAQIYKRRFYLPVWGGIYEGFKMRSDSVRLGKYMSKVNPPKIFEGFPYKNDLIWTVTFSFVKKNLSYLKYKLIHEQNINKYQKEIGIKLRKIKDIYGTIPVGSTNKLAIDRVFFFGDSGLISSPVLASGFTNVLQMYKRISTHIDKCIDKNKLDSKYLNYTYSWKEELNRDTLLLILIILLNIKYKDVDKYLEVWKKTSNNIIIDLLFMRMQPKEIIQFVYNISQYLGISEFKKAIPRKEYKYYGKKMCEILIDMLMYK